MKQELKSLIGTTPVMRLNRMGIPRDLSLYAKLESYHPGGSSNNRLCIALIRYGEQTGVLQPGGTIIEATTSKIGWGLALAQVKLKTDYKMIIVVPEGYSPRYQAYMRALRVNVINTPVELGLNGAFDKVKELMEETPLAYWPGQFRNTANSLEDYHLTGPELWEQFKGNIDTFVACASLGTSGAFMDVARFLKEQNPQIRTVLVELQGKFLGGGEIIPRETIDWDLVDEVYNVLDKDSSATMQKLMKQEGLLVGSNSGAACYAAIQETKQAPKGADIVVIFSDCNHGFLPDHIRQEID